MTQIVKVKLEKYISVFPLNIPERKYCFSRIIDNKIELSGFNTEKEARDYIQKKWNDNPKVNKQYILEVIN